MRLCSRADIATLGFAISLVTSARIALGDCFLVFFLSIVDDVTSANQKQVNSDQFASTLGTAFVLNGLPHTTSRQLVVVAQFAERIPAALRIAVITDRNSAITALRHGRLAALTARCPF